MKTFCTAAAAWILGAGLASAQPPVAETQVSRGDAHFVLGWQNLHKEQPANTDPYRNDWINSIFHGGAGAGWYWTDHIKTQVDVGAGTRGRQYRYRQFTVDGQTAYESSVVNVRQRNVSISQQYQFFRNQWVHPHLGAGVEIARETTDETYQAVTVFDNVTRTSRIITPRRTEGPEHDTIARPFVEGGMKAYMTRRSFFTTDMRVMVRHGIDEVLFRFGFGFDF